MATKYIYCATGLNPDTDGSYLKIGDTIHEDVSLRDVYLKYNTILTWEAVKTDGTNYRDYDLHQFIDANYGSYLVRTERYKKGREQYDIVVGTRLYHLRQAWARAVGDEKELAREAFNNEAIKLMQLIKNDFNLGIRKQNDFQLREEQRQAVEKISNAFKAGATKFLLDAKPRFGKTTTAYHACLALNFKKILILSFKTASKDSWKNDLNHVKFTYDFHDYHEIVERPKFSSNGDVVFMSFQALFANRESEKHNWIFDEEWDVVLLDEEHYGIETFNSKDVLDKLKRKLILPMSGTPFRSHFTSTKENKFSFTYVDEQEQKRKELASLPVDFDVRKTQYQMMPTLKMFNIELPGWSSKELKKFGEQFTDDEYPTLAKVFATDENDNFLYPGQARAVFQILEKKFLGGNDNVLDDSSLSHLFMLVPGISSAKAIEKMLKQLLPQYEVINAAGGDGVTDIVRVKTILCRCTKSITLSCGRFTEAVTVPQWGTVVILNDMKSPTTYIQSIFRAQSPNIRNDFYKKECYVVDFNLQRLLSAVYAYSTITKKENEYAEDSLRRFLRNAPIYNSAVGEIEFMPLDKINDIFEKAQNACLDVRNLFNGTTANVSSTNDSSINEMLLQIDAEPASVAFIESIIIKNKIKVGKTYENMSKNKKLPTLNNTTYDKLLLALKHIEKKLPQYMVISSRIERCVDDLCLPADEKTERIFQELVGVSRQFFKKLVDRNFFDKSALDEKVRYFSIIDQLTTEC